MRILIPVRHAAIKRFFDKYKYRKNVREEILADAEMSEGMIKRLMGDEYVHFLDAIPEIKEFLTELEQQKALKAEEYEKKNKQAVGENLVTLKTLDSTKKIQM